MSYGLQSRDHRRRRNRREPSVVCAVIEPLEARLLLTDWFAAVDGLASNAGTIDSPWDITSALMNAGTIAPGDTLYLRGGTYVHPNRSPGSKGFYFHLEGGNGAPITVRPYEGEHVILDGGLQTWDNDPSQHVIIMGLEVIVSENLSQSRVTAFAGSEPPPDLLRPWGGIDIRSGHDIQIVNNIVHHNMQGIGFWGNVSGDSGLYGNIIYDNGWIGPDRNHGHGIYTQNATPDWKYIVDNILIDNFSLNMQAYGSTAARVDRFYVAGNIFLTGDDTDKGGVLIGGQYPSEKIRVYDNIGHGASLYIGYVDGGNDLIATGNRIWGDFAWKPTFTNVTASNNLKWMDGMAAPRMDDVEIPIPSSPYVSLTENTYDSRRANLAVLNFPGWAQVAIDPGSFLQVGETYQLLDPTDMYGAPVLSGTYTGAPILVPLSGDITTYVIQTVPALAPVAANDSYIVQRGATLTAWDANGTNGSSADDGVLVNDSSDLGHPLSAALVSGPAHGSLALNPDGSFTYVHDGSSFTSDSFRYRVFDGPLMGNIATAFINVTPPPTSGTTVSFQDGVNGYSGTRDTWISSNYSTVNYGSRDELWVDGSPDLASLIKWDISSIAPGSVVDSASIVVNVTNVSKDTFPIYGLLKDFDENSSTWAQSAAGQSWQMGGAVGVQDHSPTIVATATLSELGQQTITLNGAGLALVQQWINNPGSNYGLVLQNYADAANDKLILSSSEAATASQRPKLVISYHTPSSTTASFQNGVNGYSGTRDTWISSNYSTVNYGSRDELWVDGSPDLASLIKWDISSIAPGSVVDSASIVVNVTNVSKDTFPIYGLLKDFDENSSTWVQSAAGQSWQMGGAVGVQDHGPTIVATATLSELGQQTITLNGAGLALVQQWINNPGSNYGLVLQNYADAANDKLILSSSEAATASQRPKLVISYQTNALTATGNDLAVTEANSSAVLTQNDLTGVVEVAKANLIAAAPTAIQSEIAETLRNVSFVITDLPGQLLGTASSNTIWLDVNGAGIGWFIDLTPLDSREFQGLVDSFEMRAKHGPAADRIDLLTVVEHELGHLLGAEHSLSDDAMHESLPPGVRRLIDLDEVFSRFALSADAD